MSNARPGQPPEGATASWRDRVPAAGTPRQVPLSPEPEPDLSWPDVRLDEDDEDGEEGDPDGPGFSHAQIRATQPPQAARVAPRAPDSRPAPAPAPAPQPLGQARDRGVPKVPERGIPDDDPEFPYPEAPWEREGPAHPPGPGVYARPRVRVPDPVPARPARAALPAAWAPVPAVSASSPGPSGSGDPPGALEGADAEARTEALVCELAANQREIMVAMGRLRVTVAELSRQVGETEGRARGLVKDAERACQYMSDEWYRMGEYLPAATQEARTLVDVLRQVVAQCEGIAQAVEAMAQRALDQAVARLGRSFRLHGVLSAVTCLVCVACVLYMVVLVRGLAPPLSPVRAIRP